MSASVNEKSGVIFNWKIENASCPLWLCEKLTSPKFVIDGLDHTEWTLTLEREVIVFSTAFYFECSINRVDDGENRILVGYTISVIAPDGTLQRKATQKRCEFQKHEQHGVISYQKENCVNREDIFLSKDTWTIRCRIWECFGAGNPFPEFFAQTYFGSRRMVLIWSINNFSTCLCDKIKSISMPSTSNEESRLDMSLYMTSKNKAPKDFVHIKIRLTNEHVSSTFINCKISVLDHEGKCREFGEKDFYLPNVEGEREGYIWPFIKRSELSSKKSLYLPNDVLSLQCDIRVYGNVKFSEIVHVYFPSKKL